MGETSDANGGQLLTIQELSEKCRLSISTIRRLKRQGKIPHFQPAGKGGTLLFPPDAIEQTVANPQTPASPPSGQSDGKTQRLSGPRPAWMQPMTPEKEDI